MDARAARKLAHSGSLLGYIGHLERWRQNPAFTGAKTLRAKAVDNG